MPSCLRLSRLHFLACFLLVPLSGCGRHGKSAPMGGSTVPPSQTKLKRGVELGPVREERLASYIEMVGVLEPEGDTNIQAGVTGLIDQVLFEEGQEVTPDTVLVTIEQARYTTMHRAAQANLEKSKASLVRAEKVAAQKGREWDRARQIGSSSFGQEKYEPGQLKNEGSEDPNGSTGGGKKSGGGKRGLQGGAPPDITKDLGRLSPKQAGIREKAEQVAQKLETAGVSTTRLKESIELMKSVEKDMADHRYADAARKRKEALNKLRTAFTEMDATTASKISRARDLPAQLRNELLQGADEGYPAGYESLLKSYYKALSTAEK